MEAAGELELVHANSTVKRCESAQELEVRTARDNCTYMTGTEREIVRRSMNEKESSQTEESEKEKRKWSLWLTGIDVLCLRGDDNKRCDEVQTLGYARVYRSPGSKEFSPPTRIFKVERPLTRQDAAFELDSSQVSRCGTPPRENHAHQRLLIDGPNPHRQFL